MAIFIVLVSLAVLSMFLSARFSGNPYGFIGASSILFIFIGGSMAVVLLGVALLNEFGVYGFLVWAVIIVLAIIDIIKYKLREE